MAAMNKKTIANKLLPIHSKRRNLVKKLIKKNVTTNTVKSISYEEWISKFEDKLFIEPISITNKSPLISIVVPCYNTPSNYINELIDSVISQTYSKWELILADGSTSSVASNRLKKISDRDERIKYVKVGENLGIVGNTNKGLAKAKGDYIAFMDHDDTLSHHALNEVVSCISMNPKLDLIYTDEDKLSDNGKNRLLPFFKPDWSPELLLGVNYITHFVVVRRTLVQKSGGLRVGFDGAQDFDFLLRITEMTNNIMHIPKILYHWRLAEGSTAKNVGEKDYSDQAGRNALNDAITRRNIKAEVLEITDRPTNYRLKYKLPINQPKVSIIIPFKDKADLLKQCLNSIFTKTNYKNFELILISNNSTEEQTFKYLSEVEKNKLCKIFYWNHPFNYSKINNYGRSKASGKFLVLLNNDTEVLNSEWLEELIGVASQPNIGEVGALLFYPDKTIQHAGVILGLGGMAGHVFRHHQPNDWTAFGMPAWPRNYLAVTAACVAIETSKYDQVGGLDETFTIAGNDVAIGIRLHEAGYRNVFWPFAKLMHYENVSVGSYNNVPIKDYDHSLTYYRPYINWNDPYFNKNLDLMNEQIGLRGNYE